MSKAGRSVLKCQLSMDNKEDSLEVHICHFKFADQYPQCIQGEQPLLEQFEEKILQDLD